MTGNCSQCLGLLAPEYDLTIHDVKLQASWLNVINESTFHQLSTGAGAEFLSYFGGSYKQFEDYRSSFFKRFQGNLTEEQSFMQIHKSAPQNAKEFVECMKICADDLVWIVERSSPTSVTAWMKWAPTPSVPGVLRHSSVTGGVSDQNGASSGRVFKNRRKFDVNEEAVVTFSRNEGQPLIANLNISGVARSLYSPGERSPLPVEKLRVRTLTGMHKWAGAGTAMRLRVLGKDLSLDNPQKNDYERGQWDTFTLATWPGLTDASLQGAKLAIIHPKYAAKGQGWFCEELYFAYLAGGTWIENGPYRPGWLDEKLGRKTDTYEFVI